MPRKYKNIFPMNIFLGQVHKIMKEFGIKTPAEFDREAGLKNKVARWFNEKYCPHSVDTDTLLSICKAFGKSLDWLVFGKEPMIAAAEFIPEKYTPEFPKEIDAEILSKIDLNAETYIREARLKISPQRKKKWLELLFEYWFTERLEPDKSIFKKYLDLTSLIKD